MTTSNWISVAGLFLVVVMALSGLIARLFTNLSARMSRMEFRVDLLWTPMEKVIADMLHSPHPEHDERDRLLEKLRANALTNGDAERLTTLLWPIADATESGSEARRMAAAMIIGRLAERSVYRTTGGVFKRILGR